MKVTFRIMVFNCDDLAISFFGASNEQLLVNRFEAEWINDTDVDAILLKSISSNHGLLEGDSCSHNSHLITVTGTYTLQKCVCVRERGEGERGEEREERRGQIEGKRREREGGRSVHYYVQWGLKVNNNLNACYSCALRVLVQVK